MAGLFNSFYYGKAGKADFTPEQLPSNRRQLFFDVLRVRFGGLVGQNLLYVLIQLPTIVWTAVSFMALTVLIDSSVAAANGEVITGALHIPADQFTGALNGQIVIWLLGLIPCLMIAGALKPGVIYVLRNWSRDQHSFVFSDLKDAIKSNWKTGLLVGLINALSLLITFVCYIFYGGMSGDSVIWVVPQMFVVIMCILWWMANMVIYPMMVTYQMKFSHIVRNGIIMVLARLPWSVLIWGLSVAIPVVLVLFVPYGSVAAIVIYLLIGLALNQFIYVSYANSCFDRFLNPRIEGAPVNMGLRDPMYDGLDEEDEEEADAPQ